MGDSDAINRMAHGFAHQKVEAILSNQQAPQPQEEGLLPSEMTDMKGYVPMSTRIADDAAKALGDILAQMPPAPDRSDAQLSNHPGEQAENGISTEETPEHPEPDQAKVEEIMSALSGKSNKAAIQGLEQWLRTKNAAIAGKGFVVDGHWSIVLCLRIGEDGPYITPRANEDESEGIPFGT